MESTREGVTSDGLLTVPETVEFLKLSRSAIYSLLKLGRLPYVQLGRHRRIPRKAVVAFAENALVAGGPQS